MRFQSLQDYIVKSEIEYTKPDFVLANETNLNLSLSGILKSSIEDFLF